MKVMADILFVSEKQIQRLNRRHRRINKPTDVLSLPLEDFTPGPDGVVRLGDVVICKAQAKKTGHSLSFLIKHAMLHLLGEHHR